VYEVAVSGGRIPSEASGLTIAGHRGSVFVVVHFQKAKMFCQLASEPGVTSAWV
jgi:hypothetical protein